MKPGQIAIMHNASVLHRRTAVADILGNFQKDGFKLSTWTGMEYFRGFVSCRRNSALKHLIFTNSQMISFEMIESGYDAKIFIALCERTFETVIQVLLYFALQTL